PPGSHQPGGTVAVTRPLRPSLALPDVSEGHHAAARRAWRSPVERRLRGRRRSISEGIAIVCAPQKDERGVPAGSARSPRWRKTWMPRRDAWLDVTVHSRHED